MTRIWPLIITSHRYVRRLTNNSVFSRDLKTSLPVMSCYIYTRLLSYHTFNIALLFGIFLAIEILTNWSLWTNILYDYFIFNDSLSMMNSLKESKDSILIHCMELYTGIPMVGFMSLFVSTYPGYLKELFVFSNSSYSIFWPYLYQEQQVMDLIAFDIKLQKFGIHSQTVQEQSHHLKILRQS